MRTVRLRPMTAAGITAAISAPVLACVDVGDGVVSLACEIASYALVAFASLAIALEILKMCRPRPRPRPRHSFNGTLTTPTDGTIHPHVIVRVSPATSTAQAVVVGLSKLEANDDAPPPYSSIKEVEIDLRV